MPATSPTRTEALLAVAILSLVTAAVVTEDASAAQAASAGGFGAGWAVLLLVARRWTVAALLVTAASILGYYALELPPVGVAAPAAAILYLAAQRGRVLPAAAVGGSLLAVSVAARLIEGDDISVVIGAGLGSEAALMLAVIALGDAVRNRRSLRAALARQAASAAEERRREAARQVEAERLRIAREVHDTLGHTMSVVTLQSAVAREALADAEPGQAEAALAAIHAVSGSAMAELRATLGTLRREPGPRGPAPGLTQLGPLVEGVRSGGLPVELRLDGAVDALPTVVGSTVYRIVQEALTNVLRHAHATRAVVTIRATPARLSVEVVDDGRGSPGRTGVETGQGLRGMSERVALLGGTFAAGETADGGFRVSVHLPLAGVPA
ncbi:histidine kinase [Micromonospora sp. NBRC 107095]|uniref:sensor histidine kinase n=1 Tax=Micromonospora sp. NBRC 107095 TaxID=3032209 RepID=UPI0024A27E35|nr:histidine kinase [Micromonospora sp. NBRC 107095]GLZ62453.1 two-component sensor histidine kinase [Micromonospora sp. NBRC 107095]